MSGQKSDLLPVRLICRQKIAVFLAVCQAKGLKNQPGVMVPASNPDDLML